MSAYQQRQHGCIVTPNWNEQALTSLWQRDLLSPVHLSKDKIKTQDDDGIATFHKIQHRNTVTDYIIITQTNVIHVQRLSFTNCNVHAHKSILVYDED